MPHIDIRVSKSLCANEKNELQLAVGNIMETIPSKTIANTVIVITSDCSMYKNGEPLEGVFVDVRLFKESPEDAKTMFAMKLFNIFESMLKIPPDNVQINFIELPNWASGGVYR